MTRSTPTAAPRSTSMALPAELPPAERARPAHRADTPLSRVDSRRRAGAGALILTAALLLTGCSVPGMPGASGAPDSMVRTVTTDEQGQGTDATVQDTADPDAGTAAATHDGGTSATGESDEPAEPGWIAVPSDLDAGSTTHTLSAASRNLVIDYWTDTDVSRLTPESTPIIRVSARMDGDDDGTAINVTRFNAQVQSLGTELADDTGSFAIAPPYAYTTAVALPANPTAHSTELLVAFDLLTETAPGSGVFTRQTILDTVTLGYAQPPSSSDDPAGEKTEGK